MKNIDDELIQILFRILYVEHLGYRTFDDKGSDLQSSSYFRFYISLF